MTMEVMIKVIAGLCVGAFIGWLIILFLFVSIIAFNFVRNAIYDAKYEYLEDCWLEHERSEK